MADSLFFDGINDYIRFTSDAVSSTNAYSIAVAVKLAADDATQRTVFGWEDGNASMGFSGAIPAKLFVYGGSGAGQADSIFSCPASDGWCIYGYNRAAAGTGRLHKYVFGTDTWTHEANGATLNNDPATTITFAANGFLPDGTEYTDANILVGAWWNSELSDATWETLKSGLLAWVNAAPVDLWRLNSLSSITSTVGSSTEVTRIGTTLDTGDVPAGWSDALGTPPIQPPHPIFRSRGGG